MSIYIRCPNPDCRKDLPIKTKVCPKCGTTIQKNKTYKVVVKYNGKRVVKTVPNSLNLAKEIETKIKSELISGEYFDRRQKAKEDVKYKDFIRDKYMPYAKNKKSLEREESLLRIWILPVIGNKVLSNISPFDVEKIKKYMSEKGKAPRTIEYALSLVRHTINKAIDWGIYTGVNPVTRVKKPKINNKRIRFLSKEESKKLLDEIKKHSQDVYEIAFLSLYTGMRFGEIANLTWQDIDFDNDIIYIKDPKNKENRVAYMTANIKEMFGDRRRRKRPVSQNEIVFKSSKGGKMKEISDTFKKSVSSIGLNEGVSDRRDRVVFHTLRHTFASWLAIQGTPIYTIKELMGHKTLAMTERYSHLAPDTKRQAVENLRVNKTK